MLSKKSLPSIVNRVEVPEFIAVDEWEQTDEATVFAHARGSIIADIGSIYGMTEDSDINYFIMSPKRCYNSETKLKKDDQGNEHLSIGFREHCTHYLNYLETFYDKNQMLVAAWGRIKYLIDIMDEKYNEQNFINDVCRYIISPVQNPVLHYAINSMNRDNYYVHLSYRNNRQPCLEYTDHHARILMKISLLQNAIIPLISHFAFKKKYISVDVDRLFMIMFDKIFYYVNEEFDVDMVMKLYETTSSNVLRNEKNNSIIWGMQEIRGKNTTIHSMSTVEQIIRQILPKYSYDKNIIHFNFDAINRETKFKIIGIPFEYQLASVSSSIRDEDNNSQADKFEAHISKFDEAMLLQTNVNCDTTMRKIINLYGPFDEKEIDFYIKELGRDKKSIKNDFQSNLISYLFFKEFRDTRATKLINDREYVILMIAAKRYLIREGQIQLPYIIGGRVERIITKKIVNKKIMNRILISENYPRVCAKYKNEKINEDNIFRNIAQILSSDFTNIDYNNTEYNGVKIECIPETICEEMLQFILMI